MRVRERLTTFQHFALMVGAVIGNGIFVLPRAVAAEAGRSAWLVVLATGMALLLLALLADSVASRFPNMDAAEWPKVLLGPVFGRIWLVLYFVKAFGLAYLSGQLFADVLSIRLFETTPCSVFAVLITLLATYLASLRMAGFARYSELMFIIALPLTAAIGITLSQAKLFHLLPLIGDKPLSSLLKSLPQAFYSSIGFDILWFSYPHLKQKSKSKLGVASAMLFVAAVYTLTTLAVTASVGPERLQTILYPTLTMLSTTEFSIVARVDNIALYIWLGTIVLTAGSGLYIAGRVLEGLWSKLRFPRTVFYLGAVILALNLYDFPPRQATLFADWLGAYDITLVSGSIVLFMILSRLRKGGKAHAQKG